jgi:hypothetical protein
VTNLRHVFAGASSPFALMRANLAKKKVKDEAPVDESTDPDEDDEDEGEDGEDKKKKSKKNKAEDDTDEEDEDEPEARAARTREKDRIRAIMSSPAGRQLPAAALRVALDTSMPRHAAVKMLAGMASDLPKGRGDSLRERMGGERLPDIGPGGSEAPSPDDTKAIAARILRAGAKARGEIVD